MLKPVDEKQTNSPEGRKAQLEASSLRHPALSRLRDRLLAEEQTSATITSYDRMHHRHSRS
jgi:hypothetical protein